MTVAEMIELLTQYDELSLVCLAAFDIENCKMYESIHVEADSKGGVVICGDVTSAETQP